MPKKKSPQSPQARNNAQRDKILEADPLTFLLKAMSGEGAPVRDLAGRVISQDEPLEYEARVGIAQKLLDKVLPSLTAQKLEVSGDVENTFRLVLSSGMAPPGSDAKLVEHETDKIEYHQTPAPYTSLVPGADQARSGAATCAPATSEPAENVQESPEDAPDDTRAARRPRRWNPEEPT
ncbi:MAG: hypothetical protein ACQEVT_16765 [Pseudomonadota bacterium]